MEEKQTSMKKRIVCLILAVAVLALAVAATFFFINGFTGKKASPEATPDNSAYVDPSVEVPNEKTPNEFWVDAAFITVDVILVVFIVYVLVRKPKSRKSRSGEDSSDGSEHTG